MAKKIIKTPKKNHKIGRALNSAKAGGTVEIELMPEKGRDWYEYITPFLGIKWGAIVTLIAYVAFDQADSLGMQVAAVIVAVFTLLEWVQLAWREFKRRV